LGVGFTKTVAVIGAPGQPLAVGVMVKVTVTGVFVVLVRFPLMFPLPLAAIPVTVVLFLTQLKVVEATFPESTIGVMAAAEQIVWAAGVATALGVGFTKTVAVMGVPGQPFAVGVMVKVTVMGALVVLVKLPLMLPLPLSAIPVTSTVLFLVQLKVVEATFPVSTIGVMAAAEQIVWAAGVATALGVGLTVILKVFVGPVLLIFPFVYVGVTMIVAVTGKDPRFVPVKASISPAPEVASPIDEVLLVHE
jgi:hypothetical protein